MEHIWSPWRMDYIEGEKNKDQCVFCRELAHEDGAENLIVTRSKLCFVILNRFPYTSGHLMVVPKAHLASLELLDAETRAEMMELTSRSLRVLMSVYHPDGFNIGINIGSAAGAGILDHVHQHVVPRWSGDTNFMSSLADVRVMPERLEETYQKIRNAWEDEEGKRKT